MAGWNDTRGLETWVDGYGLREVRQSECVERLRNVRLLGTMRYVTGLQCEPSRYDHSLGVARLAAAWLERLGVDAHQRELGIVIALLHDVGHLPFSHASEVYYREEWGRYHTSQGIRVSKLLSRMLELKNRQRLADLVKEGTKFLVPRPRARMGSADRMLNEAFHGILSADTLDGICRSAGAIGLEYPDPLEIINGIHRDGDTLFVTPGVAAEIMRFLALSEQIYGEYVYSARGMAAEAMLTKALQLGLRELPEMDEFLRLTDDDALELLKSTDGSRLLVDELERGELFWSLRQIATEKYDLIRERFLGGLKCSRRPSDIANSIEQELNSQIGFRWQTNIIVHPTIRVQFHPGVARQMSLFDSSLSIQEIEQYIRVRKHYGIHLEVVVRPTCAPRVRDIRLAHSGTFAAPKENISAKRRRPSTIDLSHGAVPTPGRLARFLCRWAVREKSERVLDPASGAGVFLEHLARRFVELGVKPTSAVRHVYGIEREEEAWTKSTEITVAGARLRKSNVQHTDFFQYVEELLARKGGGKYDVIVGNPPYVRGHVFDGRERALRCASKAGARLSGRASSWAPYVVCSLFLLKSRGRFAMVLPVELLSTDYARPVRELLSRRFGSLRFIFFRQSVFASALQSVLLLLASNDGERGIFVKEVKSEKSLTRALTRNMVPVQSSPRWLREKWTNLFVSQFVHGVVNNAIDSGYVCSLGDFASIRIGQVTGANKYFVLNKWGVRRLHVRRRWLSPIVTEAELLRGAIYGRDDFRNQVAADRPSYLVSISPSANVRGDIQLHAYLETGKRSKVHERRKCRERSPWYSVPRQPPPDAFLTYMSHSVVRMVLNRAGIGSTNNLHNVYFRFPLDRTQRRAAIVAFYSTLTQLSLELLGRSYGGGVLKVEPSEALRVLVVSPRLLPAECAGKLSDMLEELDLALRGGDKRVFSKIDRLVLRDALGLNPRAVQELQDAYRSLRERRITYSK